MRMTRFTIRNFRCFEKETTLQLSPITVLLGANNSGKSTFLQALNLFQYCLETTRRRENGSSSSKNGALTFGKKSVGPDEFGVLPVAEPSDLWPQGRTANRDIVLAAHFDNGIRLTFKLGMSFNLFSIRPSVEGAQDPLLVLKEFKIRLVPVFSGFLPREEVLSMPALQDRIYQQHHGQIIRNLLYDIKCKSPHRWEKLKGILGRLLPDSSIDLIFDKDVDRFISAPYRDQTLKRDRDVIIAGSGFHQALQIFAGVLTPDTSFILLDEPDAHLHARVQGEVMRVLAELAEEEATQFLIATHSPHLLSSAPDGSLRICLEGKAVPFATTPEQLAVLETVGAMERMEIVPLLNNRAIVFVENKADRNLLQLFAEKHFGVAKAKAILDKISFLYSYQDPITAGVLQLARQVQDLVRSVESSGLNQNRGVRFLAIGDRDYRDEKSRRKLVSEFRKKTQTRDFGLDLELHLWDRIEIENYLLDKEAILKSIGEKAAERGTGEKWTEIRNEFSCFMSDALARQKEPSLIRFAGVLQHETPRLELETALKDAEKRLDLQWGDGVSLCDAKKVLGELRQWLSEKAIVTNLPDRAIVESMDKVPEQVLKLLGKIRKLSQTRQR